MVQGVDGPQPVRSPVEPSPRLPFRFRPDGVPANSPTGRDLPGQGERPRFRAVPTRAGITKVLVEGLLPSWRTPRATGRGAETATTTNSSVGVRPMPAVVFSWQRSNWSARGFTPDRRRHPVEAPTPSESSPEEPRSSMAGGSREASSRTLRSGPGRSGSRAIPVCQAMSMSVAGVPRSDTSRSSGRRTATPVAAVPVEQRKPSSCPCRTGTRAASPRKVATKTVAGRR